MKRPRKNWRNVVELRQVQEFDVYRAASYLGSVAKIPTGWACNAVDRSGDVYHFETKPTRLLAIRRILDWHKENGGVK